MTILLLSPFFHPEPISTGRYNTVLAEGLVAAGQQVEVLASHPLYPSWRPNWSDAQLPGMRVRRGGGWMRYPRRPVLRRLLLELWYTAHVFVNLLSGNRRPDRVVAVFPPSLFMTAALALLPRATRIVGVVHDLQGVVHAANHPGRTARLLARGVSAVERRAFASCQRLIFLSHAMANNAIREYGLDPLNCTVCYPFVTLPVATAGKAAALLGIFPAGHRHVVYSGALGDKQNPDRLVAFMRAQAGRYPDVLFHVFSAGPHFDRLRATELAGGRVHFHPLVPEEQLDELYRSCTVQLLPQAAGTGKGSLPSKLPNLLAAGVPVFAICDADSEIVQLLRDAGPDAGLHANGFDDPNLDSLFAQLLANTAGQQREARQARQRPRLAELFSTQRVVAEILAA